MTVGRIWPAEISESTDSLSGVAVRRLTAYRGHSHHFYFTNPGWYDGGKRLLISSDRENRTNLFGLELATGELTQLTDLEPLPLPREVEFLRACASNTRDEAYYWYGLDLVALDLRTLESRVLYRMDEGWDVSMINCSADGRHLYASISEDLSDRFRVDYLRGYIGFRQTWEARPLSRIIKVAIDGAGGEPIFEERYWIGHVNTSPTRSDLLTFCHEGPWNEVDNRIWGMNADSGEVWKIRAREADESVGHEYWHADGERIGYHGRNRDGTQFLGHAHYDDSDRVEVSFPGQTGHIHSNAPELIVGDGGRVVRLWRSSGDGYDGPRALCRHDSSMKIQQLHVHPRFDATGRYVIFTSDVSGYGDVYQVEVPSFESLPAVDD
ncbi:oligogalacturonate lyase family protein [bacterium]|nr:oligogalacturonide lyase [Gemmatimonadota bacterium]MCH2660057.1 oligogalacturonate lyase family protein [bacterium]|tara:strand:+ start:375 stop:1517 length:1143 start_codon:yes stop_codon:yes gene_type:complete